MKTQLLNDPTDCQWLLDTHLRSLATMQALPEFKSFVLYGNEDAPGEVELFASQDPDYRDLPVLTVNFN